MRSVVSRVAMVSGAGTVTGLSRTSRAARRGVINVKSGGEHRKPPTPASTTKRAANI